MLAPTFDEIGEWARASGLAVRGAFHPEAEDGVPALADGSPAGTLVMLGFAGNQQWETFAASPEAQDGRPDPMDRWSRRIVDALAAKTGGMALYPFADLKPRLPFLDWAERAEGLHRSPIGLLIHPDWGLWHAYRGALALHARLDLPSREHRPSPCDSCQDKPCLSACPVDALVPGQYDAVVCLGHIGTVAGEECMRLNCRARRACPVGAAYHYGLQQATFHMSAFLKAHEQ